MKFSAISMRFFAASVMIPGVANAADDRTAASQSVPAAFQKLIDCRALTDNAARLACFDSQVAAVVAAQQNRDLVIVDREQVRNTRRSLFGLTLPNLGIFGGGDRSREEEEAFNEIETTIASASSRNGHWTIVLADGARWYQTDTEELNRDPGSGMAIRIRRAAMGSFLANVAGQRAIRVMRVN